MEVIRGIEQGSEEWLNMRLGVITSSRFKDALAVGEGKTRSNYMRQLAGERLTGLCEEAYSNKYMERGEEIEPQARCSYELIMGAYVEQVTFIRSGDIGCSPDGLVADNGMLEMKCPKTTTHIETVLSGKMPSCYKTQVQGALMVAEREWCDFFSFDPRIDGKSSYFCTRIYRDEDYIKDLSIKLACFHGELIKMVKNLL